MNVIIPTEYSTALAEETGLHAGDGSMNYYSGRGLYSLRGNKSSDYLFYRDFINPLYEKIYDFTPVLREWKDVFGFQVTSSELVGFKFKLGLPLGPKTSLSIPKWVWSNGYEADFIRGFLETDGNIYLEQKYGRIYPRIELSTTSQQLAYDLKKAILGKGLTVSLWKRDYSNSWKTIYRVCSRGLKNVVKWLDEIGTNHPLQKSKLDLALKANNIK